MKTLKVRPVLAETKKSTLHLSHNKILITSVEPIIKSVLYNSIPKELVLISLENDKIKVGDEYVVELFKLGESISGGLHLEICTRIDDVWVNKHNVTTTRHIDNCKKVISRQSQISPEYISKFIEQYNNGCVGDLEIEMEDRFGYCNKCNAYQFASYLICNYPFCGGRVIQKTEPKLTDGFVTIIEKAPQDFPYILQTLLYKKANSNNTIDLDAYTSGLLDCYRGIKEPITYTEQDMRDAFEAGNKRGWSGYPNTDNWTHPTFEEWFEQHKKK